MARFENTRRVPQDLADGRNVAPGEAANLTVKEQKEPHNRRLIDEGVLRALQTKAAVAAGGN